mmetsp:Transcript_30239/g.55207  ORF Transcript_30239/g.55207 Transcript_30239/m.55207 type:complete len:398 (+) Transcript_30239:191-1384(+)
MIRRAAAPLVCAAWRPSLGDPQTRRPGPGPALAGGRGCWHLVFQPAPGPDPGRRRAAAAHASPAGHAARPDRLGKGDLLRRPAGAAGAGQAGHHGHGREGRVARHRRPLRPQDLRLRLPQRRARGPAVAAGGQGGQCLQPLLHAHRLRELEADRRDPGGQWHRQPRGRVLLRRRPAGADGPGGQGHALARAQKERGLRHRQVGAGQFDRCAHLELRGHVSGPGQLPRQRPADRAERRGGRQGPAHGSAAVPAPGLPGAEFGRPLRGLSGAGHGQGAAAGGLRVADGGVLAAPPGPAQGRHGRALPAAHGLLQACAGALHPGRRPPGPGAGDRPGVAQSGPRVRLSHWRRREGPRGLGQGRRQGARGAGRRHRPAQPRMARTDDPGHRSPLQAVRMHA